MVTTANCTASSPPAIAMGATSPAAVIMATVADPWATRTSPASTKPATVAMITAAGLVAPIAIAGGLDAVQLAVVTISIASGASILSHVNDSGFWLVSRYFNLTEAQTLRSWTITSTLVGLTGFVVACALYPLV